MMDYLGKIALAGAVAYFAIRYWIGPLIAWLWLMHIIGLLP